MKTEATKEQKQPTVADKLTKDGTIVLEGKSREDLFAQFNELTKGVKGKLATGAVSNDFDRDLLTLRVDLIKE